MNYSHLGAGAGNPVEVGIVTVRQTSSGRAGGHFVYDTRPSVVHSVGAGQEYSADIVPQNDPMQYIHSNIEGASRGMLLNSLSSS
jgi:hypothetical protein